MKINRVVPVVTVTLITAAVVLLIVGSVQALATELASRPPLSIALIKRCVLQGSELPLVDGLMLEQEAFMETMRSDDASRLMRGYKAGDTPLNEA